MNIRDTIRYALYDAIDWQVSLADANVGNDVTVKRCQRQAADYRKILMKRYGEDRTPMERQFDGAVSVSIWDIEETYTGKKG